VLNSLMNQQSLRYVFSAKDALQFVPTQVIPLAKFTFMN
jgi:hypothetical protein